VSVAKAISASDFKVAIGAAGANVRAARDELCALDAAAGDGDLGATLDVGFAEVDAVLAQTDGDDIGAFISASGMALARKAPSTIGTLLAGAFLSVGRDFAGMSELMPSSAARFFETTATAVADRGRATAGQRTILDAMVAAAEAATASAEAGADAVGVMRAAAGGARAGAESTASMDPVHGRAGWVGERAHGLRDAGAVAWALYVEGLAAGPDPARDRLDVQAGESLGRDPARGASRRADGPEDG
jgi:phosphoenolpyruvate---glycerone phosphotransferase subunit DhaL